MTRLRRFARLPRDEQRLFASAIGCLAATQLALTLLPWRASSAVMARLRRTVPVTRCGEARILRAVRAASDVLPRTTCLARAITLQTLLTVHGLPSTIAIGVAHDAGGALVSHAWVERDGVPLLETADAISGYTRVPLGQSFGRWNHFAAPRTIRSA